MFISDTRFILKTCGTTTLIYAIKPLLSLVEKHLPGTVVTVSPGGSVVQSIMCTCDTGPIWSIMV